MKDRPTRQAPRALRPALDSVPAAPTAPAGQIDADVTAAFLAFVERLNTLVLPGVPALDLVVRDRATGQVAGVLPVSEDTAMAVLAATAGATNVHRPAPELAPVLETVHERTPDTAPTARALRLVPAGGA